MKHWAWILIFGATACGWLFLKARQNDVARIYRKVGGRTKSVRKAAERAAARPSGVEITEPVSSTEEINLSRDSASYIAKELEELQR